MKTSQSCFLEVEKKTGKSLWDYLAKDFELDHFGECFLPGL